MKPEEKNTVPKAFQQEEEEYLAKTMAVVRDNVKNYGSEVARMQADIDEMLEHYHDNNVEVLTILNNTVTMHEHMKRALVRNEKALKKPYFGRIVFQDLALDKQESLYIGKGGISSDATHWMVVDWRAPVANAYYENGLGKCTYPAPGGNVRKIDLRMKRTYEIEDGRLLDYYDSEVVTNDDLLTKYLAKNKQAVLGEIIATIQKEQNDIIRKSPYHNMIVQGVAGSGKTTVAMHRISYILYNYQERFKPDDFYIVGSNRILLNYITGVLPDLDVYGVRQMTMEQLFVRLLYEDWDDKKYRIRATDRVGKKGSIRGTYGWFKELEAFCRKLEWNVIPRESIYLNPRQFVEGLRDGKSGVYDETDGKPAKPGELVELMPRDAVERYIRQNPSVSVQSKIDMLNERLFIKVKDEFLGKGVKYTEAERKAILRAFRGRYGGKVWKRSIFELYREFLVLQQQKGCEVDIPETEFDVYDLAALAYIYKRIKETEVISEAHHVVIDEAQDFGMMAYSVLKFCIRECTYTIMGDVSQNIHFGYGLNDWEELKSLLLSGERDSFGILKKSYRNTVEISDFATNILHHGQFSSYSVEPIIRHGKQVQVQQTAGREELIREAAAVCRNWQKNGYDTIAVVCRDRENAAKTAEELGKYIAVQESDLEKAVFDKGIMVLPVEYTKGLEFDTVLILDPTREEYPVEDGHAKLLYVAATRALHELHVLHTGNLTGLIADPLPKRQALDIPGSRNAKSRTPENSAGKKKRISIVCNPSTGKEPENSRKAGTYEPSGRPSAGTASGKPAEPVSRPAAAPPDSSSSAAPPVSRSAAAAAAKRPAAVLPGRQTTAFSIGKRSSGAQGIGIPAIIPASSKKDSLTWDSREAAGIRAGQKKPAHTGKGNAGPAFGDMPATEKLRPAGHGKIDLAVRWVTKKADGLYIQSRYGILRLSPVGSAIIRVTFAKGQQLQEGSHRLITVDRTEKAWMYKEVGNGVELTTDELCLRVDKATGSVRYMTRDKKLLLSERSKESRQIETGAGPVDRAWLYLDWPKEEKVYGMGSGENSGLKLRGCARYVSHCGTGELPLLLSDKGYGLLLATENPAFSCDIPVYGTYLYTEKETQMDYYFIGGKNPATVLNAYAYLCGKL